MIKKSKAKKNLAIELTKSFFSFWGIIILILSIRWLFIEPYVIPSGSMIPNLLVYDHIVVNKFSYGVRIPFSKRYLWRRGFPERGDVVVFRAVDNSKFMIKRVVGLPQDEIFLDKTGQIWVNNKKLSRRVIKNPKEDKRFHTIEERSLGAPYDNYQFFVESPSSRDYRVMYKKNIFYRWKSKVYKVPEGHIFMLGDNRDDSSDSRVWGMLPVNYVLGRAFGIWLSCEETLPILPLCSPAEIRWSRLFRPIQ